MNEKENKKTILVLEDESSLVDMISSKLKLEGFDVVVSATVDGGLKDMEEKKIDFIWLDHYLIGSKDGVEFTTVVKKNDKWKNIPIFVVSNTASMDKIKAYKELGVTRYYVKSDHRIDDIIGDIKNILLK
ncbi:response regulator [Candidatus Azambacteria bacterium]|nr:response regulator [Candidatus Azambacteria bacterium]